MLIQAMNFLTKTRFRIGRDFWDEHLRYFIPKRYGHGYHRCDKSCLHESVQNKNFEPSAYSVCFAPPHKKDLLKILLFCLCIEHMGSVLTFRVVFYSPHSLPEHHRSIKPDLENSSHLGFTNFFQETFKDESPPFQIILLTWLWARLLFSALFYQ